MVMSEIFVVQRIMENSFWAAMENCGTVGLWEIFHNKKVITAKLILLKERNPTEVTKIAGT